MKSLRPRHWVVPAAIVALGGCLGCISDLPPGASHATVAIYPHSVLAGRDQGRTFESIGIKKAKLPPNTFLVRMPAGNVLKLEDLTIEDVRQDDSFETHDDEDYSAYRMRVSTNNGDVVHFSFRGSTTNARLTRSESEAVLIHAPSGEEISFPLRRADMERILGTDYVIK